MATHGGCHRLGTSRQILPAGNSYDIECHIERPWCSVASHFMDSRLPHWAEKGIGQVEEMLVRYTTGGFRSALPTLRVRLDSRFRGNVTIWGVQRGNAPLRFFIIPQDWGIKGVEVTHPGDATGRKTLHSNGNYWGLHNVGSLCDNGDCSMMQLG